MDDKKVIKNEKTKISNCKQLVNAFPKINSEILATMNNELEEASKSPMFHYIPSIMNNWIELFYDLKLDDIDYVQNVKLIENKPIQQLAINETLSKITFYIRQERFCGGTFMYALNSGILQKLVNHLQEETQK